MVHFVFATASRPALRLTHPSIPWVVSPGLNQPGREADHSPLYIAEVKNAWSHTTVLQYVFTAWCLIKHRTRLYGVVLVILSRGSTKQFQASL